jgi:hypothetical protein
MTQLAAAVKALPDAGGFAGFASWLVEGCRLTQPLEPLMGSGIAPAEVSPRMVVSVQGRIDVAGVPVLIGAAAFDGTVIGQSDRQIFGRGRLE